jgi:hypothetical protein
MTPAADAPVQGDRPFESNTSRPLNETVHPDLVIGTAVVGPILVPTPSEPPTLEEKEWIEWAAQEFGSGNKSGRADDDCGVACLSAKFRSELEYTSLTYAVFRFAMGFMAAVLAFIVCYRLRDLTLRWWGFTLRIPLPTWLSELFTCVVSDVIYPNRVPLAAALFVLCALPVAAFVTSADGGWAATAVTLKQICYLIDEFVTAILQICSFFAMQFFMIVCLVQYNSLVEIPGIVEVHMAFIRAITGGSHAYEEVREIVHITLRTQAILIILMQLYVVRQVAAAFNEWRKWNKVRTMELQPRKSTPVYYRATRNQDDMIVMEIMDQHGETITTYPIDTSIDFKALGLKRWNPSSQESPVPVSSFVRLKQTSPKGVACIHSITMRDGDPISRSYAGLAGVTTEGKAYTARHVLEATSHFVFVTHVETKQGVVKETISKIIDVTAARKAGVISYVRTAAGVVDIARIDIAKYQVCVKALKTGLPRRLDVNGTVYYYNQDTGYYLQSRGTLSDAGNGRLTHGCSTVPGSSGSPVCAGNVIVGVHTDGVGGLPANDEQVNSGVWLFPFFEKNLAPQIRRAAPRTAATSAATDIAPAESNEYAGDRREDRELPEEYYYSRREDFNVYDFEQGLMSPEDEMDNIDFIREYLWKSNQWEAYFDNLRETEQELVKKYFQAFDDDSTLAHFGWDDRYYDEDEADRLDREEEDEDAYDRWYYSNHRAGDEGEAMDMFMSRTHGIRPNNYRPHPAARNQRKQSGHGDSRESVQPVLKISNESGAPRVFSGSTQEELNAVANGYVPNGFEQSYVNVQNLRWKTRGMTWIDAPPFTDPDGKVCQYLILEKQPFTILWKCGDNPGATAYTRTTKETRPPLLPPSNSGVHLPDPMEALWSPPPPADSSSDDDEPDNPPSTAETTTWHYQNSETTEYNAGEEGSVSEAPSQPSPTKLRKVSFAKSSSEKKGKAADEPADEASTSPSPSPNEGADQLGPDVPFIKRNKIVDDQVDKMTFKIEEVDFQGAPEVKAVLESTRYSECLQIIQQALKRCSQDLTPHEQRMMENLAPLVVSLGHAESAYAARCESMEMLQELYRRLLSESSATVTQEQASKTCSSQSTESTPSEKPSGSKPSTSSTKPPPAKPPPAKKDKVAKKDKAARKEKAAGKPADPKAGASPSTGQKVTKKKRKALKRQLRTSAPPVAPAGAEPKSSSATSATQ